MDLVLSILCALVGIGLIVLEAFMPGFGVPGICGILMEIAAIVIAYVYHGAVLALIMGLIILSVIAIVLSVCLRSAVKGKFSKSQMVLRDVEGKEDGYVAAEDMQVFLGREGETTGALRPAGIADFDGVRLNVVSEGEFIPAGTRVRIARAEGSRIVVKPV
ncbi:MAG: hypothetical protein IJ708_02395 [Clostridia bacterium]|nr:hypothetical protein [Clostridia bacterium]MBR2287683.1 hypothetical protein [Clostridia bacterium]